MSPESVKLRSSSTPPRNWLVSGGSGRPLTRELHVLGYELQRAVGSSLSSRLEVPLKEGSSHHLGPDVASADRHAAVDAEYVTRHEAAARAEQVQHRGVELAGAPTTSRRRALEQEVREALGVATELGGHLRGEEAGGDRVDADSVPAPLGGELAREP